MKQSRRNFLKFAGLSAAGLCLAPTAAALASGGGGHGKAHAVVNANSKHAKRWAMVIDTRKLNTDEAINALAEVCHHIHNVPTIPGKQDIKWLWEGTYSETFPNQTNNFPSEELEKRKFPLLCNHCETPSCVRVCPTKATFKRADGIVAMDYHRCIGCRYCMAACPFGARSFNFMDPRLHLDMEKINVKFPTRMRGVVEKCNFCVERLAVGEMPACVEKSSGAMTFGDLQDPDSNVRKVLRENFTIRRNPAAGTEPGVYYII
ncbi:sulfate reduction electron transfer complex DsrMKJOP subunit DsrO [Maridesulfovibrio ferrireducens]|uniref:sulfate reduction electron transfer complex DsrMKJOP subunit DsrO n=1 Tax=Maridesulfovibrio ferrireducens TaxID=246191 RepID=UPI001A24C3CC|nr:4Fe-4S dicluster domain-containing protein [Maridesulfovibrio ferrireducens]MBI9112034.1 4Fe-4S dicluster domain-containing protein [Maridesulfovibrio ferrireducens]